MQYKCISCFLLFSYYSRDQFAGQPNQVILIWCYVPGVPHHAFPGQWPVISMRPVAREQTNRRAVTQMERVPVNAHISPQRNGHRIHVPPHPPPPPTSPYPLLFGQWVDNEISVKCSFQIIWWSPINQVKQKGSYSQDRHADQCPQYPSLPPFPIVDQIQVITQEWWSPHLGAITQVKGPIVNWVLSDFSRITKHPHCQIKHRIDYSYKHPKQRDTRIKWLHFLKTVFLSLHSIFVMYC